MNRFKECREAADMTQKEVAITLGVTVQAMSYWENGKRVPKPETLKEMAQLYGVTVGELLGEEPSCESKKPMTKEEREILEVFKSCSPQDRAKIIGFATGLSAKK